MNSDAKAGEPIIARIVLVEDNEPDVHLLKRALRAFHIRAELTLYEDGEQAIRAFASESVELPDLILVDLNLPRSGGFEVLSAIRAKPSLVGVPVGIFTSSDAERDRHRVALIGAERYVQKPSQLDQFIAEVGQAVMDLLQSRRVRKSNAQEGSGPGGEAQSA